MQLNCYNFDLNADVMHEQASLCHLCLAAMLASSSNASLLDLPSQLYPDKVGRTNSLRGTYDLSQKPDSLPESAVAVYLVSIGLGAWDGWASPVW